MEHLVVRRSLDVSSELSRWLSCTVRLEQFSATHDGHHTLCLLSRFQAMSSSETKPISAIMDITTKYTYCIPGFKHLHWILNSSQQAKVDTTTNHAYCLPGFEQQVHRTRNRSQRAMMNITIKYTHCLPGFKQQVHWTCNRSQRAMMRGLLV